MDIEEKTYEIDEETEKALQDKVDELLKSLTGEPRQETVETTEINRQEQMETMFFNALTSSIEDYNKKDENIKEICEVLKRFMNQVYKATGETTGITFKKGRDRYNIDVFNKATGVSLTVGGLIFGDYGYPVRLWADGWFTSLEATDVYVLEGLLIQFVSDSAIVTALKELK